MRLASHADMPTASQEKGTAGPSRAAAPSAMAAPSGHKAAPAGAPVYEKTLEVLVFEAVRTLKHAATVERIGAYIEAGYDVPPMFRKQLAAHLRSLREAGRLVMSKSAFALPGRTGVRPHLCFSYRFYAIR